MTTPKSKQLAIPFLDDKPEDSPTNSKKPEPLNKTTLSPEIPDIPEADIPF